MHLFDKYETTIGLEVHVQLSTRSKMFCSCPSLYGGKPNEYVDSVVLALPGTLPTTNKSAVDFAILLGLATNCEIRKLNQFARKHYFYPDLPKGYQISQFEEPICENGHVDIFAGDAQKRIRIKRIHMEEDAGKSVHAKSCSLVDLNRAGTPLLEVVSEPDISQPEEAIAYLKNLYQLVTYLGICDGNLEEGNFRCDANVSVRPKGIKELGTRTEIKNLNSFKFIEKAINYERTRQMKLLEQGSSVVQTTLLYDSEKNLTRPMRGKEEAADYRYFPDPDLPPLELTEEWIASVQSRMPELPLAKQNRFIEKFGLSDYDTSLLLSDKTTATFFEETLAYCSSPKILCNWVTSELFSALKTANLEINSSKLTPLLMGELVSLVENNVISGTIAKSLLQEIIEHGKSPKALIEERGLAQISSEDQILPIIREIFAKNPKQLQEFIDGKDSLIGFFVGQVMKATRGKANPKLVNELIHAEKKNQNN
jgi:aspartyl-tRNA(Asn)/glutamyl-tRNA(Gln) amidotransferase subunit B